MLIDQHYKYKYVFVKSEAVYSGVMNDDMTIFVIIFICNIW